MPRQQQCPYAIDPTGLDVHGEAAALGEQGPVNRVVLPGGVEAWLITGQESIRRLLTDSRVSKDAYQHWPAWANGEIAATWPLAIWVSVQNMITAYGDDHKRLRKLVASAFTARRVQQLRPRIEEITHDLLDELAEEPADRPVDFRHRFAHELPTRMVIHLFGIPEKFHAPLQGIINSFFDTTATLESAHQNHLDLYRTMGELLALKREMPGDDLTSALIAARDDEDGTALTEKELVDNLILLFTAGYETTVNLLDHSMCLLLSHPEQLALIRSGRADWSDAVEEALRLEPPGANGILRYTVEEVTVGDTVIGKGEPLVISFASAGRDPEVHGADADRFDVTRATRREHLSFGHGPHYCVGAQLARSEAEIALRAFFDRFPDAALAVPADRLPRLESFISNGHQRLPVVLGRQRARVSTAAATG